MSFKRNPSFERELAREAAYRMGLKRAAKPARDAAERFAHHAMPQPGRKSMELVDTVDGVILTNTNYGGHLEEFGGANVKSPVYAPLRRGILAAGLRFDGSSR